jgi:subtilisin family serine protease
MAAPLVSGLCALYLQQYPSATPAQVRDFIIGVAGIPGNVNGMTNPATTDGVLTSNTTLQYYNYLSIVTGNVSYPSTELTVNRGVFSPFTSRNKIDKKVMAGTRNTLKRRR